MTNHDREPEVSPEEFEAVREKVENELKDRREPTTENAAWWLGE